MSDYQTLVTTLHRFAEQARHRPLKLSEALDSLDEAAYAFIAIILTLPFLQPMPLGPITVAAGAGFAALGVQLLRGHESPVLPKRLREAELSEKAWRTIVKVCLRILGFCRKFTRPPMRHLVSGALGRKIGGVTLLVGGTHGDTIPNPAAGQQRAARAGHPVPGGRRTGRGRVDGVRRTVLGRGHAVVFRGVFFDTVVFWQGGSGFCQLTARC